MNTLFRPPPPVPITDRWTPNQRTAWTLITSTPGGCYADELGAKVHDHPDDERCIHCGQTGVALCKSKALRGLVIKRKASNRWEPRDPQYRAVEPSAQLSELPADFFGAAS